MHYIHNTHTHTYMQTYLPTYALLYTLLYLILCVRQVRPTFYLRTSRQFQDPPIHTYIYTRKKTPLLLFSILSFSFLFQVLFLLFETSPLARYHFTLIYFSLLYFNFILRSMFLCLDLYVCSGAPRFVSSCVVCLFCGNWVLKGTPAARKLPQLSFLVYFLVAFLFSRLVEA